MVRSSHPIVAMAYGVRRDAVQQGPNDALHNGCDRRRSQPRVRTDRLGRGQHTKGANRRLFLIVAVFSAVFSLLTLPVYAIDCQYWKWSRWGYIPDVTVRCLGSELAGAEGLPKSRSQRLTIRGWNGSTILHRVSGYPGPYADGAEDHSGVLTAVSTLLEEHRIDPNAPDKDANTPLHYATMWSKNAAVIAVLVGAGADPNLPNRPHDRTPLHVASGDGNLDMVVALLAAGADPNARDDKGSTPLHHAARWSKNTAVVRALVGAGADPNSPQSPSTPLHSTLQNDSFAVAPAMIATLVEAGADPNAWEPDGRTLLQHAVIRSDNPPVIAALLDAGADPNSRGAYGFTPLHYAVLERQSRGDSHAGGGWGRPECSAYGWLQSASSRGRRQ